MLLTWLLADTVWMINVLSKKVLSISWRVLTAWRKRSRSFNDTSYAYPLAVIFISSVQSLLGFSLLWPSTRDIITTEGVRLSL